MALILDDYADDVASGRILAGELHVLAAKRHIRDRELAALEQGAYWLDEAKATKAIAFFEDLKHIKGEWAGQPFKLEPWQQFIVGSVYGWRSRASGFRRFRRAYVEVPRKNGKSLLAAGMALLTTFFDEEPGAEGYVAATKRDQAKDIVFGDALKMVKHDKALQSFVKPNGRWETASNLHGDDSKLEPLSRDYDSMDGLNVHFAVVDEYHAHPDRGILDVLETALGARRQPLLLIITTAGEDLQSPCGEERSYSDKILRGVFDDPRTFAFIAHADGANDDEVDPFTDEAARQANPNYGISVKPDDLAALAAKAREMPGAAATYKQKRLNWWVSSFGQWFAIDGWRRGQSDGLDLAALEGQVCYGGVDLSSKTDLSSIVLAFPPTETAGWRVLSWFFTPEEGIKDRAERSRAPYVRWVKEGYLVAHPGARIDQTDVGERVKALHERYAPEMWGFDPWNAGKLLVELAGALGDDVVVEVNQTMLQLSDAFKELQVEVLAGRVDAGDHPVMRWCVSNTVGHQDDNENARPSKKRSTGRIDGVSALTTAAALALRGEDENTSVYDQQGGFLTLS